MERGVGVERGRGGGETTITKRNAEFAIVKKTPHECFILLSGTGQE